MEPASARSNRQYCVAIEKKYCVQHGVHKEHDEHSTHRLLGVDSSIFEGQPEFGSESVLESASGLGLVRWAMHLDWARDE